VKLPNRVRPTTDAAREREPQDRAVSDPLPPATTTPSRAPALLRHYLPDLVYGANDGIITTFAVVSGVVGASLSSRVILILGFANLVADGFSMGASNFLARRSFADEQERAERPEATRHAVATLAGFVAAGFVPLLAYLAPLPGDGRYAVACALTLASLFVVGAGRAYVTRLGYLRSGLEMLLIGAIAAGVAYGIGALAAAVTGP
jgi:VIT1/CCC1 family predicted Fe2+/Mn2+ transporter